MKADDVYTLVWEIFHMLRFIRLLVVVLLLAVLVFASLPSVAAADNGDLPLGQAFQSDGDSTPGVAPDAPVVTTAPAENPVVVIDSGGMSLDEIILLAICALFFLGYAGLMYVNKQQGEALGKSYPPEAKEFMKGAFDSFLDVLEKKIQMTPNKLDDALFAQIRNIPGATNIETSITASYEDEASG